MPKKTKISKPLAGVMPDKLLPGQISNLDLKNIGLSKYAADLLVADPETQKRAAELVEQIKTLQAEIDKLAAQQKKLNHTLRWAEEEKHELAGDLTEQEAKVFSYIEQHCSDFLKNMQYLKHTFFLYRGVGDDNSKPFVGRSSDNRQPKDSSSDSQEKFDSMMKMAGFKALRSNSIFCTSNARLAEEFGHLHAIFPINGFSYLWSPRHEDIVLDNVFNLDEDEDEDDAPAFIISLQSAVGDADTGSLNEEGIDKKILKYLEKVSNMQDDILGMDNWHYDWSNKPTVQNLHKKVMTLVKMLESAPPELAAALKQTKQSNILKMLGTLYKYLTVAYPVSVKKHEASQAAGPDKKTALAFVKHEKFTNKDLSLALGMGNEVCINGTYVAIPAAFFDTDEGDLPTVLLTKFNAYFKGKSSPKGAPVKGVKKVAKK